MGFTELEILFLKCCGYDINLHSSVVTISDFESKGYRDYVRKQLRTVPYFKSGDNSISFFNPNADGLFSTISKDHDRLYLISTRFSPWLLSISLQMNNGKPTLILCAADNKNDRALKAESAPHITERFVLNRDFDKYLSIEVSSSCDGINSNHQILCSPINITHKFGILSPRSEDLNIDIFSNQLSLATFQRSNSTLIAHLFAYEFRELYCYIYGCMIKDMQKHSDMLFPALDKLLRDLEVKYQEEDESIKSPLSQSSEDDYSMEKEKIERAYALLEGLDSDFSMDDSTQSFT